MLKLTDIGQSEKLLIKNNNEKRKIKKRYFT